ncbi:hypothetical protein BO83DRAFT_389401 [Aspergillus eucalypticola CBS 122712]|uniref:Uncharacterized protein n=1 Tax=Aspergillus eucalypticola (strain CBS 122712 / IBT 29274) TaxID=1448314 RepID=A0A317VF24_ASPEC|nr:uncharacterized protein BO83DRAFT_389401 [Aspergillus eucalypticola CBS 122712]PWY72059.1 hypothetical protein BO83DRAFT_389401 [Aspergillus eucalypticola CBS 122712]
MALKWSLANSIDSMSLNYACHTQEISPHSTHNPSVGIMSHIPQRVNLSSERAKDFFHFNITYYSRRQSSSTQTTPNHTMGSSQGESDIDYSQEEGDIDYSQDESDINTIQEENVSDQQSRAVKDLLKDSPLAPGCFFLGLKIWHLGRKIKKLTMPVYFESQLSDYALSSTTSTSIRSRVDAILLHTLSVAKKWAQSGQSKHFPTDRTEIPCMLESVKWSYQDDIYMEYAFEGETYSYRLPVDYMLWYGNRENWQANLIVIRAKHQIIDLEGRHSKLALKRTRKKKNMELPVMFPSASSREADSLTI